MRIGPLNVTVLVGNRSLRLGPARILEGYVRKPTPWAGSRAGGGGSSGGIVANRRRRQRSRSLNLDLKGKLGGQTLHSKVGQYKQTYNYGGTSVASYP